jgi:hypothetical protein
MEEKYSCERECDNGLASKWWGPAWWTLLYSLADARVSHTEFGIRTLARALPCKPCRTNFAQHLRNFDGNNVHAWLDAAHSKASQRVNNFQENPRACAQTIAFVAKCIAINYPLDAADERCTYSCDALTYIASVWGPQPLTPLPRSNYKYVQVFKCDPVSLAQHKTRAALVAAVDAAFVERGASAATLEALRHYDDVNKRTARFLETRKRARGF